MNPLKFQSQKIFISFILCFSLFYINCYAGIPEPETIIYGKIINNYKGYNNRITSGSLAWQIIDANEEKYLYSTNIENVDNEYSYVLTIPKETVASIILNSGTYLFNEKYLILISDQAKKINHSEIIVNGHKATIMSPAKNHISLNQDSRLDTFRIDLAINYEPKDSDNDGIPDFWEITNNTNPNSSDDALLDPDNDGWNNKKEFEMGSNPVLSNLNPKLADGNSIISIPEGSRIILNLNILDSDSNDNDIMIKLIKPPVGGNLILCPDSENEIAPGYDRGNILKMNDVFSVFDIISGKIHLKHTDPDVNEMTMQIQLWNNGAENEAKDYTISALVWNPTKELETSLWVNMFHQSKKIESDSEINTLFDLSGNNNNSIEVFGFPTIHENVSPSGKASLFMDGRSFYRFGKNPLNNAAQIFSVFQSTGYKTQTLWAGTNAQLNFTDKKDPVFPGKINVITRNNTVFGNISYNKKWLLSSIDLNSENSISYINNRIDQLDIRPSQLPISGVYFQIGAQQEIVNNESLNELSREYKNQFEGCLSEILVIAQDVSPIQKWRINAYLLSKWFGQVITDLSNETKDIIINSHNFIYLDDMDFSEIPDSDAIHHQNYILIGGLGNDQINASCGDDILIGGQGKDIYKGLCGKDIFVVNDGDTILDFNNNEGDVIHIADILKYNGGFLNDYIQFEPGETFSMLNINVDGQGDNYTDAVIRIENRKFSNSDIKYLWANGNIDAGSISMPVTIESVLIKDFAEESKQDAAEIEIIINCEVIPKNLSIPYYIEGDCEFGEDFFVKAQVYNEEESRYVFKDVIDNIPVILKPGDNKFIVKVVPVIDNISEKDEKISLTFRELSSVYKLSNNEKHEITIKDGIDIVRIQTKDIQVQESVNDLKIVISRNGSIDLDNRVDLIIKGNAENGNDYTYIPSSINLRANESEYVLKIKAFIDEEFERIEVLELLIKESESYVIDDSASSVVISIVDVDSPFANAGNDITAICGEKVVLDGSLSADVEQNAEFLWEQIDGIKIELNDINSPIAQFEAPILDNDNEILIFKLVVTDQYGMETSDKVNVYVNNPLIKEFKTRSVDKLLELIKILKIVSGGTDVDEQLIQNQKIGIKDALLIFREIGKE